MKTASGWMPEVTLALRRPTGPAGVDTSTVSPSVMPRASARPFSTQRTLVGVSSESRGLLVVLDCVWVAMRPGMRRKASAPCGRAGGA